MAGCASSNQPALSRSAQSFTSGGRFTPGTAIPLGAAQNYVAQMSSPLARDRFKLNSRFGPRGGSFHEGLDLAAESGTNIYAAHSGEVVYAGEGMSGYGKLLVLRDGPIMTVYGHNRKVFVGFGDLVEKGQKIAEVGSTGRASGPHLHFEVRVQTVDGTYAAVDPFVFYP